ncbi:DNA repair exonuclease [Polyplosphaeria fusca]|uniref:Double-strand break repair protein n=1 Tax=Polyplosphaeria fusca TaxID=682080 RepID=A0A9P4RAN0_9PLEO|nr:DNA repair exonuclease [Polyplosphaeria fusca]
MAPRATPRGADTIRILVATDSHVGYNERDKYRSDDSWKTFHEVMCLAKEHDVDMVLHGGDLFHDNVPSRLAMYNVMSSLRMNCLGDKPCELEMLSDASENFGGVFDHVNYEDPDINVAIPVFAIHGNHDDPSGVGTKAALDILQMSGLVNYFGRNDDATNLSVKPVLLQKGRTKLALYGISNIRDERLFRTFREGNVKFFQPGTQKDEWFNLMTVHQNHHAYTETGYLPENFLPEFTDLVVWGHEHESLIEPRYNPEMGFHVIQPGSSIATSLMPGEAVPKHVTIVSVTGKEFTSEPLRLKTVRPFVMKEIVLAEEPEIKNRELWAKPNNRTKINQYLTKMVEGLIGEAKSDWLALQDDREHDADFQIPLPIVRLRVEHTAPDSGDFQVDNPQRFSQQFSERVANGSDVVQFYRKKKNASRALKSNAEIPDEAILDQLANENVKIDDFVKEFFAVQALTILPQNLFGDAVAQFVHKDDKQAMQICVDESLDTQRENLLKSSGDDEEEDELESLTATMTAFRTQQEDLFAKGKLKKTRKTKLKPKPAGWDSDADGPWEDQPAARIQTDAEDEEADEDDASVAPRKAATRGRGRGRGRSTGTRATAATSRSAPAAKSGRGRKKVTQEEEEDEDEDVIMVDDDDDEEDENDLFVKSQPATRKAPSKTTSRTKSPPKKATPRTTARPAANQSTLNFTQSSNPRTQPSRTSRPRKMQEPSDDEISDDDDAFDPAPTARSARSRR